MKNIRSLSTLFRFSAMQNGFTFLELVIVMGIIFILLGFMGINLIKVQRNTSVNATIDTLTADLTSAQTKAMAGQSDGGVVHDNFGIYFQPDRYILFHGSVFSLTDPSNFTVMLDNSITFSSITFPNNTLLFSALSGEVINFVDGQNTVTIKNMAGTEQKTITINRYGVIIGVN